MPFTLDGQWIPAEKQKDPKKPVKVRKVKRGQSIVTVVLNLSLSLKEMEELSSKIKKRLGCGGSVKGEEIEVQGDKVDLVKKMLEEIGIKSF